MDRKQFTGILVIMLLFFAWTYFMQPSDEELRKAKEKQESILHQDTLKPSQSTSDTLLSASNLNISNDSASISSENKLRFGSFATSATGNEENPVLENENIKITFSSKGGKIKEVLLKHHYKTVADSSHHETKELIKMLNQPGNRFDYNIPVDNALSKQVNTADLYFQTTTNQNTVTFRAPTENGGYFEQQYTLDPNNYVVNYSVKTSNLAKAIGTNHPSVQFTWLNHLSKYERGENFEQNYSTVYFKEDSKKTDYCSCVSDDTEKLDAKDIHWFSHTNQFFNSSIIAKDKSFSNGIMTTKMTDLKKSQFTKITTTIVDVPVDNWDNSTFEMTMYIGPNEFEKLRTFNVDLENIIPFGSSIFGTINRWVIRPFFDFLSEYIGSKGIVIILLIFLIKMALYPLMYKMLHSQAKMGALKPEINQIKEKYKNDMQQQQMETMKIYREFGVSPFGGCLPMILQMPIWYALFRFFPASITFRQEPFLWATDLSSYDVMFYMGFEIPFFGAHVSLFTLLWTASTIVYTYYNMQNMDMSANPAMKYVQYIMPVMFLGFFNNYASGLTCYMFFSNLFNIIQTVVTKNYIFDEKKIREELLKEKAKPKKKSNFQQRLEEAMKQQQAMKEKKGKK